MSDSSVTDEISLRGLTCRGRHGVLPDERRDGQLFVVDAVLRMDTRPAAASDALADTADYGALAQALAAVVEGDPVDLLETLAARLVAVCLADPRIEEAEVTVQAPIPLAFSDVSVTVRRRRGP